MFASSAYCCLPSSRRDFRPTYVYLTEIGKLKLTGRAARRVRIQQVLFLQTLFVMYHNVSAGLWLFFLRDELM